MGYITAAIKTVADCNVGDTITESGVTFKVLDCRGGGCTVEVTKPA